MQVNNIVFNKNNQPNKSLKMKIIIIESRSIKIIMNQ